MISLKRIAILFLSVGIFSCSQEVLEPAQQVTGKYARDDGSEQTDQYIEFSKGILTVYESDDAYPLVENNIWDVKGNAFSKKSEQKYSIEGSSLLCSGPVSGEIKKDGDRLTIGRGTYIMLKGSTNVPFSAVKPEKLSYEVPFLESAYSIPVEVENPIKSGIMSVFSPDEWISDIKWENGILSYHVSSTQQRRTGTIALQYTHSKEVELKISQVQQTFIILPDGHERTVNYEASSQVLAYTVENPTAGGTLRVTSSADWVYDIEVRENEIIFNVEENNFGNSRTAQLTLSYPGAADVVFNLTQSWASSEIVLTPASSEVDYTGGPGSFDFEIQNPRQSTMITVQSQADWITNVSVSGSKVSYTVAENNSGARRTGKIKLRYGNYATKEFSVIQGWSASTIVLTPASSEVDYTGGPGSFDFEIQNPRQGTMITAQSQGQADWITDVSVSGTKVSYTVAENNSGATRTGKIKLTYGDYATGEFSVTQGWSASTIVLSSASSEVDYTGGPGSFDFEIQNPRQSTMITVQSQADWITNVSVSGTKVSYTVAENNSGATRAGKIKLSYGDYATKEFSVTQGWSASTIVMPPASSNVDYAGGPGSFDYEIQNPRQGVTVTAQSLVEWITGVSVSATKVSYTVAENNGSSWRTGRIRLSYGDYATKEFSVTQTWSPTSITLTPTSQAVDYKEGSFNFSYAISNPRANTSVTATSQNDWITDVKQNGTIVSYKVAENNSYISRTGKVTLTYGSYATVEFTVTQYRKPVVSLSLNKSELPLLTGASETLIATVDPSDAPLKWSSNLTSVATVDQNGKVTAKGNGNATITVEAGKLTATCTATVMTAVTGISIDKTSLNLQPGEKNVTLQVTVNPSTASNKSVIWTSGNTSVAKVDQSGKVEALEEGTAQITVKTIDGGYTATCLVTVKEIPDYVVNLDLPSGLLWASCNLGASKPEEYGDYYAWGETATKSNYTWETYKFWISGSGEYVKLSRYNMKSSNGTIDNQSTLWAEDDAASSRLGREWRMPTKADFDELFENTNKEWTTINGVKGYKFTSKNNSVNWIFLPSAGDRYGTTLHGGSGTYWSSSLSSNYPSQAYVFDFGNGWFSLNKTCGRYYGLTVRPVTE